MNNQEEEYNLRITRSQSRSTSRDNRPADPAQQHTDDEEDLALEQGLGLEEVQANLDFDNLDAATGSTTSSTMTTYTNGILNPGLFETYWHSKLYKLHAINELWTAMIRVDYSVIASRREGHVAINDFSVQGVPGGTVFDDNTRFRHESRADHYIPDSDLNFSNTISALASVLSWRSTSVAKDTQASTETGGSTEDPKVSVGKEAGLQDNTKRFEELVKELKTFGKPGGTSINREIFEREVAHWT